MNRYDNQLHDNIGDDVRSAFDDMFDEARIDATAPPLDVRVARRVMPAATSRMPVTRAAAAVAVLAVGVMVAVAVRSGRDGAPLSGPSISAVDSSLNSTPPSTDAAAAPAPPATAVVDPGGVDDSTLLMYDVATGEVVDSIESWGEPGRVVLGAPYNPPGSGRAYFFEQVLNLRDMCEFTTGRILSVPWPDPPIGPDGLPDAEVVTEYGGRTSDFSPDGSTLIYDVHPGCTGEPGGPREPKFHGALRLVNLGTGEEMTLTTRIGADDTMIGGIIGAVMTPGGELVVELGPGGDVYRLTPTDGAIIEESGVLIANVAQWGQTDQGLPRLLSADDSSITVHATTSMTTDHSASDPNVSQVWRGPAADGTWTELVRIDGQGSVDDDGYGNLVVVAAPGAEVVTDADESIPVLWTAEAGRPVVRW